MTFLVPIMLFGWIPLTVFFFFNMRPRVAVLCSVIGGFLLLPMASYDLPGLPNYTKSTAIAFGLLLGGVLSGQKTERLFQFTIYDFPMVAWCFVSPVITSLTNGLGLYDGISGAVGDYFAWGVFWWAGRVYFEDRIALNELCRGIIIGGLIYVPLCLFELRMSPQLSNIFYGFFPHSFAQHIRYGGYRPIVFMQHGLMVALWMAQAFNVTFWFWRGKRVTHLMDIPVSIWVLMICITAILCKSVNGWFFLLASILCFYYYKKNESVKLFKFIILLIPVYIFFRVSGIISAETIQGLSSLFIEGERVQSLSSRLFQEDLFSAKAMRQPLFGWGGWNRGWPINPMTGEMIRTVDAIWTMIISERGLLGLTSLYLAMLLGPWLVCRRCAHIVEKDVNSGGNEFIFIEEVVLSLVVVFFMIDSLMNGMVNSIYILCSGALVSSHITMKNRAITPEPSKPALKRKQRFRVT